MITRDGGSRNVRSTQGSQEDPWRHKMEARLDEIGRLLGRLEKLVDTGKSRTTDDSWFRSDNVRKQPVERRQRNQWFYGRCFECGKVGHMAADCRQNNRPKAVTQMGRPPHVYIEAYVNGQRRYSLLDSGSEISIVNSSIVRNCRNISKETKIKSSQKN